MKDENQNEIVESQNTEIAPEQRYYNGPVTLEEAESYITSGLVSTARNYVAIGYWLRRIRDGKLYEEEGIRILSSMCMKNMARTRDGRVSASR